MKILNRGATRSVLGHGLVNHGDVLDLNDTDGEKLLKVPGFKLAEDQEGDEPAVYACGWCDKPYKTESGRDAHEKSKHHEDD